MFISRSTSMKRVAIIGSYVPRQCGIATFTFDLRTALANQFHDTDFSVVALNDKGATYDYPEEVKWQIHQECPADYREVAEELNAAGIDRVSLQHEYGIFGGEAGEYLLLLLRALKVPVVTTLHTVLENPSEAQKRVMDEIIFRSSRLIVMSKRGAEILKRVHNAHDWKIEIIPHGVHNLPHSRNPEMEKQLGIEGKQTLLTFGLLSPDKGIENVISALPEILKKVPNAIYMVVGATHPQVKANHGETYRDGLVKLAKNLGVEDHVVFHNRYVAVSELGTFLSHADVYVTPYLKPQQITSGTLAYAMGCGRAIISTPYWYAEEVLDDGRGILVPFANHEAISEAAINLLVNDDYRKDIQEKALAYGSEMLWPLVGARCMGVFEEVGSHQLSLPARAPRLGPLRLPSINLNHLQAMTDSTGLFQHATHDIPNYTEGYCIDDNARALILMANLRGEADHDPEEVKRLARRYLAFVQHAFQPDLGRFKNFMLYDRTWTKAIGSEDSHGRTVWALGVLAAKLPNEGAGAIARDLLFKALPAVREFTSPRAWAYVLLGLTRYMDVYGSDPALLHECSIYSFELESMLRNMRTLDWVWFEDRLSYCNARLPQALMLASRRLGNAKGVACAVEALEWLHEVQTGPSGFFEPVGSDRTYIRGTTKPRFDQQPVDVHASLSAYLAAVRIVGDQVWMARAESAYGWFMGENHLGLSMYDPTTGGGYDGLHQDRINMNQGAESTLSFLLATAELKAAKALETPIAAQYAFASQ